MRKLTRRAFVTGMTAVILPSIATAQTYEQEVTQQLRRQGFDDIRVNRTLLGRVRVVAKSATTEREIVINPGTGAILRDFTRNKTRKGGRDPELLDRSSGQSKSNSSTSSSNSGSNTSGNSSSSGKDGKDDKGGKDDDGKDDGGKDDDGKGDDGKDDGGRDGKNDDGKDDGGDDSGDEGDDR